MANATEEDLLQQPSFSSTPTTPKHDDDDGGVPTQSSAADQSDSEGDDIAPNFLNLSLATSSRSKSVLPKRGLKDFEANPTLLQSRTLAASRDAMHEALSYVRVHNPNDDVVGVYDEDSGETFVSKKRARGKMFSTVGRWRRGAHRDEAAGVEGQTAAMEGGWILEPEEALWALESGRLDIRYPYMREDDETVKDRDGEQSEALSEAPGAERLGEELGMPMSLQGAYAAFIGDEPLRGGNLTGERYTVYAALKRAGYIVTRAEGWDGRLQRPRSTRAGSDPFVGQNGAISGNPGTSLFTWLYKLLFAPKPETEAEGQARQRMGPLVAPGLYRSYEDIYRLLRLIPSHQPQDAYFDADDNEEGLGKGENSSTSPYTTTFNVYKASPQYRKSAPGPPDFRICVISARDTTLPTLLELSQLMDEQPELVPSPQPAAVAIESSPPSSSSSKLPDLANGQPKEDEANGTIEASKGDPKHTLKYDRGTKRRGQLDPNFAAPNTGNVGHMYSRLKRGSKGVILAIVDEGIVSYLRFADADFGAERLYERSGTPGSKGGRKGGGRGRGRGRGG